MKKEDIKTKKCTRSKKLLGAPGIATRSKDATRGLKFGIEQCMIPLRRAMQCNDLLLHSLWSSCSKSSNEH